MTARSGVNPTGRALYAHRCELCGVALMLPRLSDALLPPALPAPTPPARPVRCSLFVVRSRHPSHWPRPFQQPDFANVVSSFWQPCFTVHKHIYTHIYIHIYASHICYIYINMYCWPVSCRKSQQKATPAPSERC